MASRSLDRDDPTGQAFAEGVRLFNTQRFFEAHEALEALWLKAQGPDKVFLHGLIQIAAAFHHHLRRNPAGFRSLLAKGLRKIEKFGVARDGIDLAHLRQELQGWQAFLDQGRSRPKAQTPPLPRILKAKSPDEE